MDGSGKDRLLLRRALLGFIALAALGVPVSVAAKSGPGKDGDGDDGKDDDGDDGKDDDGDNSGPGKGIDNDDDDDDDGDDRRDRHRDEDRRGRDREGSYTLKDGTRIDIARDRTVIAYRDGWREILDSGRYELRDARDRQVVERAATARDKARIEAMLEF